jgi:hypothetical protein
MPVWAWVLIGAAAALLVCLLVALVVWQRRRAGLRERFGGEYERAVARRGDRRQAEAELAKRERRREKLLIRPLPAEAQERYAAEWRAVQSRFVDAPAEAVRDADRLITEVMVERGYPMREFEARAADLSVDYPETVENYRFAHALACSSAEGRATTEDLRKAMQHYRALFEELLEPAADEPPARERERQAANAEREHDNQEVRRR